jgi:hypothetical protein
MHLKIIGEIADVETIASGTAIRERRRLWKFYVKGRRRKLKGTEKIRLTDGTICMAEVHWYEAHSVGAKEYKIKRLLD